MTIYIHNPAEPHGVPTQAVIDVTFGNVGTVDLIQGRCGYCPCVPKVWRMVLPSLGQLLSKYAGVYYLRKDRYTPRDGLVCRWTAHEHEVLPDAHPMGGWYMRWEGAVGGDGFEGFGWVLYSPAEDIDGFPVNPARWIFNGHQFDGFRCMRPNNFRLQVNGTFPYRPQSITLSPFHP